MVEGKEGGREGGTISSAFCYVRTLQAVAALGLTTDDIQHLLQEEKEGGREGGKA